MKKQLFLLMIIIVSILSCESEPPPPPPPPPPPKPIIIIEDPLVLQNLNPLPRAVVPVYVEEFEPIYTAFRIIEVSEVDGVQRYFLARIGADRTGIEIGVTENITEDAELQKVIGKYRIVDIFGEFFQCEIQELDYKIGDTAYIRVKTGERLKAKE